MRVIPKNLTNPDIYTGLNKLIRKHLVFYNHFMESILFKILIIFYLIKYIKI